MALPLGEARFVHFAESGTKLQPGEWTGVMVVEHSDDEASLIVRLLLDERAGEGWGPTRRASESPHPEDPCRQALLRVHRVRRVPDLGVTVHPADQRTGKCVGFRIRREERRHVGRRRIAAALPGKVPVRVHGHQRTLSQSERHRQSWRNRRRHGAAAQQPRADHRDVDHRAD